MWRYQAHRGIFKKYDNFFCRFFKINPLLNSVTDADRVARVHCAFCIVDLRIIN